MTYALFLVYVCCAAILFRIPRGTGLGFLNLPFVVPKGGELLWAVAIGVFLAWQFHTPWALIVVPLLLAGEAPSWSSWWPNRNDGGNLMRLNIRGLLLLNPVMGYVYFWTYTRRYGICKPRNFVLDGWTAYAELLNGFVTAGVYYIVIAIICLVI